MKNLGLQNVITGIFIFAAVIALLVFSGLIDVGSNTQEAQGKVTVWGTIPYSTMQKYIERAKSKNLTVSYKVQDPLSYESDLVNAIAAGRGPDLFIMPHADILRNKDKIFEVPYVNFPRRDYTNRYIRASELFLTDTGVLALPMSIDPLVMYYNKGLMDSAFILDVPQTWNEVLSFTPQISISDANGRIALSGGALGTYRNINNSKAVISALLTQNGNRFVDVDPISGKYRSTLALTQANNTEVQEALRFYTSFADVANANYSWNEALPTSLDMFISGDLGLYFGRASEITDIQKKNPNLNFNVAFFPQQEGARLKSTFGYMDAIAISKQGSNIAGALAVASVLTGADISEELTQELGKIPARKDLLSNKPEEEYLNLFYNSAIIADAWIDPAPKLTSTLIENMIRNINSDALSIQESISRAHSDLNTILDDTINMTVADKNLESFN